MGRSSFKSIPAILYLNWLAVDSRQFALMAFSFIVLLVLQMTCFYLYSVGTPPHWRSINTGTRMSERFLCFVQKFDAPGNCFPSMHVSVAMLTALHAAQSLGPWACLFPVLIALSCIFTKQHSLIGLPFGAVLGVIAFKGYELLL